MSLTLATLLPGLVLILLGVPLLLNHSGYTAILKAFHKFPVEVLSVLSFSAWKIAYRVEDVVELAAELP